MKPPMSKAIRGRATVVAATTSHGKWYQSGAYRYNFVLDVEPGDGSPAFRTELTNVRIFQATPQPGSEIAVEIVPGSRDVKVLWKGDPTLDLDALHAHRRTHEDQVWLAALRGDAQQQGHPAPALPNAVAQPTPPDDPPARLERLQALNAAGALSVAEFEQTKARILAEM